MSSNEAVHSLPRSAARRPPPPVAPGWMKRVRQGFFDGWLNGLTTLLIAWALLVTLPGLIRWAVVDAVWFTRDAADCRAAAGACWAVVPEKYRVMLFGTFPYDEQWRGVLVVAIILALALVSALRKFPVRAVLAGWAGGMALVFLLMSGGVFGLAPIATHQWSGLPLTLIMFVGTIAAGVPLGVVLALGRRSHMPVIKALCVGFIEIVRGLPLVTVLFMA
jgi:general L-amino acid transport system permease protein